MTYCSKYTTFEHHLVSKGPNQLLGMGQTPLLPPKRAMPIFCPFFQWTPCLRKTHCEHGQGFGQTREEAPKTSIHQLCFQLAVQET